MEKRELQIYFLSIIAAIIGLLLLIKNILPWIKDKARVAFEKREILKQIDSKNLSETIDDSELKPSSVISRPISAKTHQRKALPNYFLQSKAHQNQIQAPTKATKKHNDFGLKSEGDRSERAEKIQIQKNHTETKLLNNLRRRREREPGAHDIAPFSPTPPSVSISSSEIRALQDLEYELCLRKDEEEIEKRQRYEQRIEALRNRFEQEPEGNQENIVTICFRLKDNIPSRKEGDSSQIKRRFSILDSFGSLLDFVESVYVSSEDLASQKYCSFEMFCFSPLPLRLRRNLAVSSQHDGISEKECLSLKDSGILKNTVFWVKFEDSS